MSVMYAPPHPGLTLKCDILPALRLSASAAAAQLGVSRHSLVRVLNGQAPITADLAVRVEHWLGIEHGGRAEIWLEQQLAYDVWQARQGRPANVVRARIPEAA